MYLTMKEAISVLVKMSWPENEVTFTPVELVNKNQEEKEGEWLMWEYEGLHSIVPLYLTDKKSSCGNSLRKMISNEIIGIGEGNELSKIPKEILDQKFHVSINIPFGLSHMDTCEIFNGGKCTCPSEDDFDYEDECER
jgi:hypothetical protein